MWKKAGADVKLFDKVKQNATETVTAEIIDQTTSKVAEKIREYAPIAAVAVGAILVTSLVLRPRIVIKVYGSACSLHI